MEFIGELGLMEEVKKFGKEERVDRFRAESSVTCCITAVEEIENDVFGTPLINNYNLALKNGEKSVEVPKGTPNEVKLGETQ